MSMKRVVRCGDAKVGAISVFRHRLKERQRWPQELPYWLMAKNEYGDITSVGLDVREMVKLRDGINALLRIDKAADQGPDLNEESV